MRHGPLWLAAFTLICSSEANADWQYTKWGMSPEQVVSASKGGLHIFSDEEMRRYKMPSSPLQSMAGGEYASGKFMFVATLYFDSFAKLQKVVLRSKSDDPANTFELLSSLTGKYGKPIIDQTMTYNRIVRWNDANNNLSIELSTNGGIVAYSPLISRNNSGL